MAEKLIRQIPNTVYDQMVFPHREWSEFPMAIPVVDGVIQPTPYDDKKRPHPVVIVQNQAELDALRAEEPAPLVPLNATPGAPSRVENEDDVREALYAQAKREDVTIDKRWSVARIEETLKAASKDVV